MLPSNWFHYLWLECSQEFGNTFVITLGQFITKVYNIRHTSTDLQTDNKHSRSFCLTVPCWLGCGLEINICSWEPWARQFQVFIYRTGQCTLDTYHGTILWSGSMYPGYRKQLQPGLQISTDVHYWLCSFGWERLLAASPSCQCQIWSPPGP